MSDTQVNVSFCMPSFFMMLHHGCTNAYNFFFTFIVLICSCGFPHSSLRGKHLYQVPADLLGNVEHVMAVCDSERSYFKVVPRSNKLTSFDFSNVLMELLVLWFCLAFIQVSYLSRLWKMQML